MDDVIKLVAETYTSDEARNQIPTNVEPHTVFCRVRSVGRSEYYAAAQAGLKPELVFTLSHFIDYQGEPEVLYTDWTGVEKRYVVMRTYSVPDSTEIEITVGEKVGRNARH